MGVYRNRKSVTGWIDACFKIIREKMNIDPKIEAHKTELEQTRDELNDILHDMREQLATLRSIFEDSPTHDKHADKFHTRKG
jgi:hypothetical protein